MSELKEKENEQNKTVIRSGLRDLAKFSFAGFLVWCTFHYPMSENMRAWFFVWAVLCSF